MTSRYQQQVDFNAASGADDEERERFGARVDDSGHSEDFEAGAEAMRAACIDLVVEWFRSAQGDVPRDLKEALEGVAP
jgi:hypothetical protein